MMQNLVYGCLVSAIFTLVAIHNVRVNFYVHNLYMCKQYIKIVYMLHFMSELKSRFDFDLTQSNFKYVEFKCGELR